MASGKLGSADLTANSTTLIYNVPVGKVATLNLRIVNRNASSISVKVAIGSGVLPTPKDYIDFDVVIPGNGMLEDTAIVCSSGEKIWVDSSGSNVSVRAHGFEENE